MPDMSFNQALTLAEVALHDCPDITARELIDELRETHDALTRAAFSTCRTCGHPIYFNKLADRWQHEGLSGNVGCRAASFDRDGDWDDALDRRAKAAPPRKLA